MSNLRVVLFVLVAGCGAGTGTGADTAPAEPVELAQPEPAPCAERMSINQEQCGPVRSQRIKCLVDAVHECRVGTVLTDSETTYEGGIILTRYEVIAESGGCRVLRTFDASGDTFSDRRIVDTTCQSVRALFTGGSCLDIQPIECGPDELRNAP